MPCRIFVFTVAISFLLFSACSLKYENSVSAEDSVPELISENAEFSRTENSKEVFHVKAENLERYKDGRFSYAKGISFQAFNSDGNLASEGKSDFISADSETQEFILLDNIHIKNHQHQTDIFAQSLRWNGNTEQLTSQKDEEVVLQKDNLYFSGKDFSSSAASGKFSFGSNVHGTITDSGGTTQ